MSIGQSDPVHLNDPNLRFIRVPARSSVGLRRLFKAALQGLLFKGLAAEGVSSNIALLSVTPPVLGSSPHQQSPFCEDRNHGTANYR